jgi:hypothetical protein
MKVKIEMYFWHLRHQLILEFAFQHKWQELIFPNCTVVLCVVGTMTGEMDSTCCQRAHVLVEVTGIQRIMGVE